MRRRLPVIQPTDIERRAFLFGLLGLGSAAACASEPTGSSPRTRFTPPGAPGDGGGGADGGPRPGDGGTGGGDGGGGGGDAGFRLDGSGVTDASPDAIAQGCATSGVDCGAPGTFAMGTLTYVAAVPVFIGRDAGGLYAMHPFCTHTIGNLNVSGGQLVCAVHGARFSLTGDVLQGPATAALPHFAACLKSNGNVAVDNRVVVPSTTRLQA
jgi:nitrite reductase/ring-hydroxylating ferredoxin subunit